jgi:hypothetical protein
MRLVPRLPTSARFGDTPAEFVVEVLGGRPLVPWRNRHVTDPEIRTVIRRAATSRGRRLPHQALVTKVRRPVEVPRYVVEHLESI